MKSSPLARLPRDTRDTWMMLAIVAWVIAPLAPVLPWWCSSLSVLLMVWRGALAWREQVMPPRWVRLALLALCVGLTLFQFRTILGPEAGVTLIVTLLAIKTLELRARRDALVVFYLCFFLLLTQFFYSQSLLSAIGMVIGVLGLLTALINAHTPTEPAPLLASVRLATRMVLLGMPVMVALFVLFPRVAPLWGLPSQGSVARSGLSGEMNVGSMASLALDSSVALRLRFDGAEPSRKQLYFRGPVLSEFDGRQWRQRPPSRAATWPDDARASGPALAYELSLQAHHQPWLLTLEATLDAPALADGQVRAGTDLQWLRPRGVHSVLRYQARAYANASFGQQLSLAQRKPYLALPAQTNPRTRQWAAEMLAQSDMKDPHQAGFGAYWVGQVLGLLYKGDYRYTLQPGSYGAQTADVFWFERRAGFCEHIASGFAVLMRALGVPARIVTGYQGGERNPLDGYWTVRQSDAHAWTEVWLMGQGWVRVDPTAAIAPERISLASSELTRSVLWSSELWDGRQMAWLWQVRWAWEALNNRWIQWVLAYEQQQQLALLTWLGIESAAWPDLIAILAGLALLASLLGAGWLHWQASTRDPWLRALARARARLQTSGLVVPAQASARELAQALQTLAADGPDQASRCQAWIDCLLALERWRYARPQAQRSAAQSLATLRRQCQHLPLPRCPVPATQTRPGPAGP